MNLINKSKGFTLIELLVVIAIIGVLSSVVMASLGSARGKGSNAAIKSGLANMRSQAELFYGTVNGFQQVCTSSATNPSGITKMLAQATSTGTGIGGCADSVSDWSAYAQLKVQEGTYQYWCVGSSGASKGLASVPSPWIATSCQ